MTDTQYLKFVRIIATVAIAAGVVARVFDFGNTPPGLNQDEASIGYDAWSLLHYGIDRAGVSWPVHRIDYGNGGNASYAYIAMPFVSFGLSPFTVRLPMLISGLASLLLIWIIARKLFDEAAAWGATAVVALSPWHIMLSRWALEGNILPFLFLCGLALLVFAIDTNRKTAWLIAASAMFGVSVYSYGAAYLAVPLFVLSSFVICLSAGIFTMRQAALGALIFSITIVPIALYVVVNVFQWRTIELGGITIPLLPTQAAFETQLSAGPFAHVRRFLQLMATQRDGTLYNVTNPYGVLYSSIFFCLAVGLVVAAPILVANRQWPPTRLFISLWVIACIPTGIVQPPNLNRINLLLMGLVIAAGLALATIDKWIRGALILGILSISVPFCFFAHTYFTTQRDRLAVEFVDGLLPALKYAQTHTTQDTKICITGRVNMPQVYSLFSEARDPREYARSVQFVDPASPVGRVASYGRYTFGLERCNFAEVQVVVARRNERVSEPFVRVRSFGLFDVYALPSDGTRFRSLYQPPPA